MRKRNKHKSNASRKPRVRAHVVEYSGGKPTAAAKQTMAAHGITPAFDGELMRCEICGAEQISDASLESNWRCIDADAERVYFCPDEFPPDGAGADEYELAYSRALLFVAGRTNPTIYRRIREQRLDRPLRWKG